MTEEGEEALYYSTTNMPMAAMDAKVARYQVIGTSLYRFIKRQWISSRAIMIRLVLDSDLGGRT